MQPLTIREDLAQSLARRAERLGISVDELLASLLTLHDEHDLTLRQGENLDSIQQMEATMHAREQRWRDTLEAVPVAILITRYTDSTVLYANVEAAALLRGETPEKLVGSKVADVYADEGERAHLLQKLKETGVVSNYEVKVKNSDGSYGWRLASIQPITFDGQQALLSEFLDITRRKRIEQALEESEARYSGIVGSAMDAIISIDEGECITVFNHAAEMMFGCSAEDAIGQSLSRFLPDRYRTMHSTHIRSFGETGVTTRSMNDLHEVTAVRSNGEEFPIEATISQVRVGGKKHYSVILRDVTERKQQLKRLQLETEKMRIALQKEKELVELKGRFISTVSHEFRTPLAMIMSSAEMLERYAERMSDERKLECLRTVRVQSTELASLMNDVLIFNKATTGKIQFKPEQIDVNTLLNAILAHMRPTYNPDIHRIVVENQDHVETFWGDETLLKRICINLVDNGIKFSPRGGEVRLTVMQQPSSIVFRVSDQGIGIPAEEQQRMFETFHRLSNHAISGTGLGLSIVKEFVHLHQGKITVKSQVGQGTVVTVELPLIQS